MPLQRVILMTFLKRALNLKTDLIRVPTSGTHFSLRVFYIPAGTVDYDSWWAELTQV